jgi:integrase
MSTRNERPRPYRWVQRMRDRYGRWRHYLRRPGFKRVALPGTYGDETFAAAYAAAMGGGTPIGPIGASRTTAGSLGWLITAYKISKQWVAAPPEGLAANSKKTRGPILEKIRSGEYGGSMVREISRRHVADMLEAYTGHQRRHALRALRGLFAFAIEIAAIEEDPSAGIKVKLPKSDGYHTWEDSEREQYRAHWPLGTEARLTLEFALETASRRCEVTRLGRQHVKGGRIIIKRAKGCHMVDIAVSDELQAAIDAMPRTDRLTFLANANGEPYTPDALGHKFAQWATEAGLPQRCRLHGLRKSKTAELATNGAAPHQIMGVTGHRSLQEVQRYADKFNRARAADQAMALLKRGTPGQRDCKTA